MILRSAWNWLVGPKESQAVQTPEDNERRKLQESLIAEHRHANAVAREAAREAVPLMNARYVETMDRAMAILRRE